MEMAKAESPSHQGQMVNLSCIVRGAKPEATVTWFNGTEVLSKTPESDVPPQREVNTLNLNLSNLLLAYIIPRGAGAVGI